MNKKNNQALISAASNGRLEVVKYLIEQGADIHAKDDSALMYAAEEGYLEIVKYLIDKGANLQNVKNNAFLWASKRNSLEVVKYFISDHNCDVNIALQEAKKYGSKETINWCEDYIQSKQLNDKLELSCKKDNYTVNKKVKI